MDFWDHNSTAQQLIKSFAQFRKVDWNKHSVSNLKPSEIHVLFCIKKGSQNEDMTVSTISKLLRVTSPTVTQIVNRLDQYGLIERIINKQDRRSVTVCLTTEGENITEQVAQKYEESINGLIDYLGEDQSKNLIDLLDKVFTYYKELNHRR